MIMTTNSTLTKVGWKESWKINTKDMFLWCISRRIFFPIFIPFGIFCYYYKTIFKAMGAGKEMNIPSQKNNLVPDLRM